VQQWAKNLLIFIPLLLSHDLWAGKLLAALAAFACFSLAASSAYIANDLLDIEADRRHVRKRSRPFASGDLRPFTGLCIAAFFLATALIGSGFIGVAFHGWLVLYLVTTVAYTWLLKRFALVDVLALSGLYILRLLAGAAATGDTISHWLAGFSMFLFLSLAIVKRFSELENLRASQAAPRNGRGYLLIDLEQMRAFGTASAYAAIVVLWIYIAGQDVSKLYRSPGLLWMMAPLMLLWLNRIWLLAGRGKLEEDPVAFALKDRFSQLIGLGVVIVVLLAL
jgi:4-hydroxybenzoate polyprenyltransferase